MDEARERKKFLNFEIPEIMAKLEIPRGRGGEERCNSAVFTSGKVEKVWEPNGKELRIGPRIKPKSYSVSIA